jgi:class 3 adenylate cyclase/HAMP domain-containing protein
VSSFPLYDRIAGRIKNKILFSVLIVFVVLYGATLSVTYSSSRTDLLKAAADEARSTAETLALTFWRYTELGNDSDIRNIQSYLYGLKKIINRRSAETSNSASVLLEVNVINADLVIQNSTIDDKLFTTVEGEIYRKAVANLPTPPQLVMDDGEVPFVHVVYPVTGDAGKEGVVASGAVELKFSLERQFHSLALLRVRTAIAGIVILLAITVVITIISNSITKPIQNLYAGMNAVNEEGDLAVQVPVISEDELGYLTSSFNHMIDSVRVSNDKLVKMITSSQRFVPEQFLSALGRGDITDVRLGDAILRDMSVFFMDIRGFTDMSQRMTAEENLTFLNSLLERILPSIEDNHGFIDKYMGDSIMALFEDPDDALLAAVDLRREVLAFNQASTEGDVDVGIGINSGELILGTMGTSGRIDTTGIGSTVNVASRLESLTKEFKVPIIIAETVYEALSEETRSGLDARELGPTKIRGIDKEMNLFGVTG